MNTELPIEHQSYPKIARLRRECVITEKIDGTNAQVLITESEQMFFGSRTRWLSLDHDNFGFMRWALEHQDALRTLGAGRHFGEWWGAGIQRKYGLAEKRFSLFNTTRWCVAGKAPERIPTADTRVELYQDLLPACCSLVPVLYRGPFTTGACDQVLEYLQASGSQAAPGFMHPEGIVCYHVAGKLCFKQTLEDDAPKAVRT